MEQLGIDQKEKLKLERPRLVVEAFSGGDGLLLDGKVRSWFTEGDYKDSRYMSIDPAPMGFAVTDSKEWGLGINGRVEEVMQDVEKTEGLEEVWVKNPGSLKDKKKIWDIILNRLPSGGKLVIYDDYTPGLSNELDKMNDIFGPDIRIDNFTGEMGTANHPLLKRLYETQGKTGATALEITKR